MIKKLFALAALTLVCASLSAQTFIEWQDPRVNEVNRAPMHASYTLEDASNYLTLEGLWSFNWVKDADSRPTDFWKKDFNDKGWDQMPVPGNWELNGYGDPLYLNIGYAWKNQFVNNPPEVPVEGNHVGSYRKEFEIPAFWSGKDVLIHFGSVTSCIYLWVNGKFVGYSEDSKLECEFDITKFITPGAKNLFAMQVFRWCDGTYLEDQDFFRLCGIARDSYMYARSKSRIEDIRVTPDLDQDYRDGTLDIELNLKGKNVSSDLELFDAQGKSIAKTTVRGSGIVKASLSAAAPNKWTAETPYLYTLKASTADEVIPIKVGFRKIELKDAQVLVNGQPVLFKGADRHELDPDRGYVVSRERMLQDIQIMKEFNLNAVRTCHYPDDSYWYELCDEYGIYMVAEADVESHGMGYGERTLAIRDDYALAHLQRNQRNVQRNYNHPAIIFWSLGNEAGYGPNFEAAYDWVKANGGGRPVQYERADYDGKTDIFCPMYADYDFCVKYCEDDKYTKPLIQCEYAHAMGNSGGGFKEYWDIIRKYPKYQGGFIWDFVDQSLRWTGKNGEMIYAYGGDFNRYDGSDTNFCDNGLISPDRVPNPHMYEVGYYYQNIWTDISKLSQGSVNVYNENFFRDLSAYRMEWKVLKDGIVVRSGVVENLKADPRQHVDVPLAIGRTDNEGEWLLNVSYILKDREGLLPCGHVVAKQQFSLRDYDFRLPEMTSRTRGGYTPAAPVIKDSDRMYIIVEGENFTVEIDRSSGYISRYCVDGVEMLKEGSAITPSFWRAPTDNDFGANLQRRYLAWKDPHIRLKAPGVKAITTSEENGIVRICCELEIVDLAGLSLEYEINNAGVIRIHEKMQADPAKQVSNLFRFGMQIVMPRSFEKVVYYGRGPIENYVDRKDCTDLGIYSQTVDEQFYPYIRPQENGTKSDLRWWNMLNAAGNGIRIESDAAFSASALHYTVESLDEGLVKQNRHSPEVPQADLTNVLVDKLQMGLGCVNSWGALPLEKYMLPYQDYEFTFQLSPVSHYIVRK